MPGVPARLAVDLGSSTLAAVADGADGPLPLAFDGEDGPAGTLGADVIVRSDGALRVGAAAAQRLDEQPRCGVRGPLAHLEGGAAVVDLVTGPVPVTALVAAQLRHAAVAAGHAGLAPAGAALAVPPDWPPDGRRARALLAAAALAGLGGAEIVVAPEAAVAAVRAAVPAPAWLVCDVGGRSTVLSVVRVQDGEPRLAATTAVPVGADLFDELLFAEVLAEIADPDVADALERAQRDPAADAACARARGALARAVRAAREALADAPAAAVEVPGPAGAAVRVRREQLAALVEVDAQAVAGAAREQLARAAGPDTPVVLVGGAARTPGVADALRAGVDGPVVVAPDPILAIARGALALARRPAAAPAAPAGPEPPALPEPRVLLHEVVAADVHGDELVAVVRHESHHRVVRMTAGGRVTAAQALPEAVRAVSASDRVVAASGATGCLVLSGALRPLVTLEPALVAAVSGATVWTVPAAEPGAELRLVTSRVDGSAVATVADEALGLRAPRRGSEELPAPVAHPAGSRLLLAVSGTGSRRRPQQARAVAGPDGLRGEPERIAGPPWVVARVPSGPEQVVALTGAGVAAGWATTPAAVALEPARDPRRWTGDRRVALAGSADGARAWAVAGGRDGWEAVRVGDPGRGHAGDGEVEAAWATPAGLHLVLGPERPRTALRLGDDGAPVAVAGLDAPFAFVGTLGDESVGLLGRPGEPRTLVAF